MEEKRLSQLKKLRITRNQWRCILKWALYSLSLVGILVIQSVILSRLPVLGAKVNLVPWFVGCVCFIEGPDSGSIFALLSSLVWALSGGDLGFVSILVLTFGGMGIGLLVERLFRRQIFVCMACCLLLSLCHEGAIFALRLYLHTVTPAQFFYILIPGVLLGIPACPVFFYLCRAICRTEGGRLWNE